MSTSPPLPETLPQPPALQDARFADAFASGAVVGQVDLGSGLWAIRRSGGTTCVLYVHNPTDQGQEFRPALVFGDHTTPHFLSGEISTTGGEGAGLVCRLAPRNHVWLATTGITATTAITREENA